MKEKNWNPSAAAVAAMLGGDLINGIIAGTPGGIEMQEAAGQRALTQASQLPTDFGWGDSVLARRALEIAGVKFLGEVKGDPLFQHVTLPEGWRLEPTDHAMWSKLLDERGRERAAVFYKAAFYDRKAHISVTKRFSYRQDYDAREKQRMAVAVVLDGEQEVYRTEPVPLTGPAHPAHGNEEQRKAYLRDADLCDEAAKVAKAWLAEKWPAWEDPSAYWEVEG